MHLIEVFLPLQNEDGSPFPPEHFQKVREELIAGFGGITMHSRAPAEGFTERYGRDQIVILEVVSQSLDHDWWSEYRLRLERRFKQDDILIRATAIIRL